MQRASEVIVMISCREYHSKVLQDKGIIDKGIIRSKALQLQDNYKVCPELNPTNTCIVGNCRNKDICGKFYSGVNSLALKPIGYNQSVL